ncbi:acyl-CoA-binding protein [Armillaria novae-zelandiae]|uniref:Acyl-CoA-binding protein n=1 Tax=Armillaria novae-zelandiae TaxID=153914 RepID=A0AA39PJ88_9AGAR|nr:acyl-CoA-binding protein [Armillaria novae-zelandiae]
MSEAQFKKAVEIVQSLPKDGPVKPTQDEQLFFYSYYKQGTIGDVNTERPGLLDFVGKAKWDAWNKVKCTSKEEAQAKYVEKLTEILQKTGDETSAKYLAELEAAA